jgi:hypothetical protein
MQAVAPALPVKNARRVGVKAMRLEVPMQRECEGLAGLISTSRPRLYRAENKGKGIFLLRRFDRML